MRTATKLRERIHGWHCEINNGILLIHVDFLSKSGDVQ
jgi:hypothetical protein